MEAEFSQKDKLALVTLNYPRNEGSTSHVEIQLCDVRAADSIMISYDFDRDGWKIEQASKFEWTSADEDPNPDWQEVAFVQAWGREVEPEEK